MLRSRQIFKIIFFVVTLLLVISGCKQVKLSDADYRFARGEYFEAANLYRKVYRKTPAKNRELRGLIAYRQGESYRLINSVPRAKAAYANAARYLPKDSLLSLQYARILHKNGDYQQAAEQYTKFLEYFPNSQFAINGLQGTALAVEMKTHPTKYRVKREDLFNSRRSEFSPMLLPPEYEILYFTSSREDALGDEKSSITGLKNNDIFMSKKDENGKWQKPDSAEGINTEFDEGVSSFTVEGSTMYYTFSPEEESKPTATKIYVSQRSGGAWTKGTALDLNRKDTVSVFAHPSITPSGDFLYFVSDMPGGYGGKDIWRAAMIGEQVNYIENLGPEINTSGDEMFPFARTDSTLYFSSDGHPGMGGLDIFKASLENKKWIVANMGVPINAAGDDFGITFDGNKENGFFSSNRNDGRGYDHIYSFEYPVTKITLEGFIVDKDDEFVPNATIRVVGKDGTNEKFNGRTDGTYRLQIDRGTDYVLLASGEGYLNSKMDLSTLDMEKDTLYYVDFVLYSINKPNIVENIFYAFDKADLRPDSKDALNELIELLEINPNVTIELSAHTDRKGSDQYNERLALRRAESVVNYLVAHGIKKDRLEAAGYGKKQPKVVTKNIAKKYDFLQEGDVLNDEYIKNLTPEQQEIADQINRRTEFKVLSITYGIK